MKYRLGVFLDQLHGGTVVEDRKIEGLEIGEKFTLQRGLDCRADGGDAMALPLCTHLLFETTGVLQQPAERDADTERRDEHVAARDAAGLIERRRALK